MLRGKYILLYLSEILCIDLLGSFGLQHLLTPVLFLFTILLEDLSVGGSGVLKFPTKRCEGHCVI